MIVKIHEIAHFTRATPGSSLVILQVSLAPSLLRVLRRQRNGGCPEVPRSAKEEKGKVLCTHFRR